MKSLIAALAAATLAPLTACTATPPTGDSPDPPATSSSTPADPAVSTSPPMTTPLGRASATTTHPAPSATSRTATTVGPSGTHQSSTSPGGPGSDRITVTIPPSITGADRDAAKQAIDVWRNAMRLYDASMQDPDGKDWATVLNQYVRDPAAAFQLDLLNTLTVHKIHQIGATRYDATVVAATDHNVQIAACVDVSHSDVVDQSGESAAGDGPLRFRWKFNLDFYPGSPGHWFLNYVTKPDPSKPC